MSKSARFRNWSFLIYPDSAPSNFLDIISSFQVPCALSPLHDHDFKDDGSPDKPHYHFLLTFSGVTSFDTVKSLSDQLSGVLPVRCLSVIGSYRYFIHLDNPEKWQYDSAEIRHFGGFRPPGDSLVDEISILEDILSFVVENNICEVSYLARVSRELYPAWNRVLLTRNPYFIFRVIDSNRLAPRPSDNKPDCRSDSGTNGKRLPP